MLCRLAKYLLGEHRQQAALDRESFERIVQWLDLNGQYYGDYSWCRRALQNGPLVGASKSAGERMYTRNWPVFSLLGHSSFRS
jgi:hypothetical protein